MIEAGDLVRWKSSRVLGLVLSRDARSSRYRVFWFTGGWWTELLHYRRSLQKLTD